MRRLLAAGLAAALLVDPAAMQPPQLQKVRVERRISFHNRLLLNRAVLAGLQQVEVLLLASRPPVDQKTPAVDALVSRIARLGGQIKVVDRVVGYVRAEI